MAKQRSRQLSHAIVEDDFTTFVFVDDRRVLLPTGEWPELESATTEERQSAEITDRGQRVQWQSLNLVIHVDELEPRRTSSTTPGFSVDHTHQYLPLRDIVSPAPITPSGTNTHFLQPSYSVDLSGSSSVPTMHPDAIRMYLEMHPIAVRESKRGWMCVAGLRSFSLANHFLPGDCLVPVRVHISRSHEHRIRLEQIDLFLTPVLNNLGQQWAASLTTLWHLMRSDTERSSALEWIAPGIRIASRFARLIRASSTAVSNVIRDLKMPNRD